MIQQNIQIIADFKDNAAPQLQALKAQLDEFANGVREGAKAELDALANIQKAAEKTTSSAQKLGSTFGSIGGSLKGVVEDLNGIQSGTGDVVEKAQSLVSALTNVGKALTGGLLGAISGAFSNSKESIQATTTQTEALQEAATSATTRIAVGAASAIAGFEALKFASGKTSEALKTALADYTAELARLEAANKVYATLDEERKNARLAAFKQLGFEDLRYRTQYTETQEAIRKAAVEADKAMTANLKSFFKQNISGGNESLDAAQKKVEIASLKAEIAQLAPTLLTVGGGIAALGAAASAAFTAIAMSARDAADANSELADKLGISTERLEALKVIADENSGTVEGLTSIYDHLQKSLVKLDENKPQFAFAAESLGTSLNELKSMSKENAAALLVKNFQDLGESEKATAAMTVLLGSNFRDQIPAIKAAADQIDEATNLVKKYGAEATPELVEAGGKQERALTELKLAWKGFGNEVALATKSFVEDAIGWFTKLLNKTREVIAEIKHGQDLSAESRALPENERQALFKRAAEEAKKTNEDALTVYYRMLEAQIKTKKEAEATANFRKAEIQQMNDQARKDELKKKSDSAVLKTNSNKEDPYQKAVQDLERMLSLTKENNEYEKVLFETREGKYAKFNESQKEHLLNIAKQIDKRNELLKFEQQAVDVYDAQLKKQAELGNKATQDQLAEAEKLSLQEYEMSLAGKTAQERDNLVAIKREEIALQRLLNGLSEDDVKNIKAGEVELSKRRAEIRKSSEEVKVTNEIIDNSKSSIENSVTVNLAAAKKLLDQNKITQEDYLDYQKTQLERLTKFQNDYQKAWVSIATGTQDILQTYLFDAMQGKFDNIGQAFKKMIDQMVAQALAAKLANALFGNIGNGAAGVGTAGGGWIGAFASTVSSWFGGAHANGGDAEAGKISLVGEKGPELMIPKITSTIVPNNKLPSIGSKVYFSVQAIDSQSFEASIAKHEKALTRVVKNASSKYGI